MAASEGQVTAPPGQTAPMVPMQPMRPQMAVQGGTQFSSVKIQIPNTNKFVDLMEVYPSPTNNLEVKEFEDPSRQTFMLVTSLSNAMSAIKYLAITMLALLIVCIFVVFIELAALADDWDDGIFSGGWYVLLLMSPLFILLGFKCYVFHNIRLYFQHCDISALLYHYYGMKVYYSLAGDMFISFLSTLFWLFLVMIDADYFISFESVGLSTITWCVCFPGIVYCIFGTMALFQLPNYFKQYGYRRYQMTNDDKYCLMYDYQGVLTLVYKEQCICNCCDSKGGLQAISIWMIVYGVIQLLQTLAYWQYAVSIALILTILGALHIGGGTLGIQLQSSLFVSWQLKASTSAQLYHEQSIRASVVYTCLSFLYVLALWYLFIYIFLLFIILTVFGADASFVIWLILALCLWMFLCYLPFHATQLITTMNQKVNSLYRTPRSVAVQVIAGAPQQTNGVVVGVPVTTIGQ